MFQTLGAGITMIDLPAGHAHSESPDEEFESPSCRTQCSGGPYFARNGVEMVEVHGQIIMCKAMTYGILLTPYVSPTPYGALTL